MKPHTKLIPLVLSACMYHIPASAQQWIDVTDAFVVNPTFLGNDLYTGWQGTAYGSASPVENAEHYSRTFDSYQTIRGLKPGTYRLSLSAFYRSGEGQNDYDHYRQDAASYQHAQLYATSSTQEFSTPIALASSAALEEILGGSTTQVWSGGQGGNWWGGGMGTPYYIPNNMEAAYYWFQAGYYRNVLDGITVDSDGQLRIGIRKNTTINADWTCLDDWKLEYYGNVVATQEIRLDATTLKLEYGEQADLHATIIPQDATYQTVNWYTSDEEIATVDNSGHVTTHGEGECEIYATAIDNEEVYATCNVVVHRQELTSDAMVINEIQSKNVDMFVDPSFNYGSWIELYNPTDAAVSLGGCYVSDDPDNLMKHRLSEDFGTVPAHGFKTVWFDHNSRYGVAYRQVDFKLDCDGGTIYLSDPDGNLVVSQDYPEGIGRASWARTTDGGSEWGWTSTPTPTASNQGSVFCTQQLAAPVVDTDGKMFTESFYVKVAIPKGATLRYTTDGTTPTLDNGETHTSGTYFVARTSIYRWRLYQDGKLPSPVVTRSYIKQDKDYTLPVVSIVTDPRHMTSDELGIDVRGVNGRSGNGTSYAVNYNMDWDRPASFEYIDRDAEGNVEGYIQQEANISISGGWSRKQTPRSLKVKATKVYDLNSFDYRFFDTTPYDKQKTLLLRNGGNDGHAQERIKDAAIHEIVRRSGLYCDLQEWNPTHVFVNGKYRGMLNMRNPSNKQLPYAKYGIDGDEIDAFEMSVDSGYVQSAGTRDKFNEWYELSQNAADPDTWQQLCDLVDMDEYCNYMAVQFNLQNWDWPHNNLKGFRERRDGAKFHMVLFDVDNVFEQNIGNPFDKFRERQWYTFYPIFEWGNQQLTKEVEHVTIFMNMLQNETFRKKFIDTYCLVNGSVFAPERCAEIIDEMAAVLRPAMALEGYGNNVTNRANTMKNNFNANRQNTAIRYIRESNMMGLSGTQAQTVSLSSNISEGRILLNGMNVPTGRFQGGLFSPVTLRAEAPAGYQFRGWKSSSNMTLSTMLFNKKGNWEYYNQGSLDNTDWASAGNDVNWNSGQAPFGYGGSGKYMDVNSTTKLGSSSNRKLCCYFRKTITLSQEPAATDKFRFSYIVDDGFRVHVNGQDVGGYHCEKGDLYSVNTESHNSNWYEGETPAEGYIDIPASYFHKGVNVIALDLHNCNSTSSDMFFDASLEQLTVKNDNSEYVSTDAEFEMPSSGNFDLVAVFEPETDRDALQMAGAVPVKVNEVSAGNTQYVNDYFKKDDWIELYNNTDQDIDIAGMYISDKAKSPLKFQIPADMESLQTVIPARGHLVIWASKRDIIGEQIHTNFKLENEDGAMVILTSADQTWSDTLTYNMHDGQETVGRYPDGGQNVYHMTHPTIAAANQLTDYAQYLYTYIYNGIGGGEAEDAIMALRPSDARAVEYYTVGGMKAGTDRALLRPGIYLVRYTTRDGEVFTRKEVIR